MKKAVTDILEAAYSAPGRGKSKARKVAERKGDYAAEVASLTPKALSRKLKELEDAMHEHARNLEFEEAARLRDQLADIRQQAFLDTP